MQLLSLSIASFKSFAKPTTITFAPGVTAIVGPNGCGKSNIVDAVRWVLGEQRSSVLRGDRMDNVIFNGTVQRKPSSLAEVKMVFDNSSGRLGVPHAEVEVARRLFRDGTSEYLLNGHECRLKDISDMLRDSGMGPNLYSVLELKMVEDILREDGEGRRALFEEAAGVATYKLRRRQSQQKLRQTDDDLLRLTDIVAEVERQVSTLKRQALRAKRYEQLSHDLRRHEAALICRDYRRLKAELDPLEASLASASASSDAARAAIQREESALAKLRLSELDCDREAGDLRRRLSTVVAAISSLEAEEAGLNAQSEAARQTIERTRREQLFLSEKQELLRGRIEDTRERADGIREELTQAEDGVTSAAGGLEKAAERLQEAERQSREHAEQVSLLRDDAALKQKGVNELAMARVGLISRRDFLEHDIATLESERSEANSGLESLRPDFERVQASEQKLRDEEAVRLTAVEDLTKRLASLEESARSLASLIDATRAKLDLLATLEEKGPRSHSALKALRTHPVDGLLELLGDAIDADERYRRAFQTALGPAAYYYLTETVESALAAMEMLRRENAGQTTFLPISEFRAPATRSLVAPEGTLGTAVSLLKTPAANSVVEHFLSHVVFVADWPMALEHYEWAKETGCTLVTLDGQWIAGHGPLCGGSEGAATPVDLGLSRQMSEARQSLAAAEYQRDNALTEIRGLRSRIAAGEQERLAVQRGIEDLAAERGRLREQQVKLDTRLSSLAQREQSAREQIAQMIERLQECDADVLQAQEDLRIGQDRVTAAEAQGSMIAQRLIEEQRQVSQARDVLHEAERARDDVRHRLDLLENEQAGMEQTLEEIRGQLSEAGQNAERAERDIEQVGNRRRDVDAELVEKYRERDYVAQEVEQIGGRLDGIRQEIAAQDERLHAIRDAHSSELEGERKIEIEIARLRGELNALLTNARTQFGFDPSAEDFAAEHAELHEVDTSPEAVQEIRQRIERLGLINPLAVEEYESQNARLESMLKQRDDLLKAKQTLEETISRINETANARFLHTFESVRAHFQRLFQEFFVAGEADLMLSGSDLLEADITLLANPSGKRLKSLSLMSGGEKTMTAIALLFALYQVKPSPFCVFDEVDAPLDDANIDRFNRMIRAHSEHTQFILVTHNRRTMEIADNLYGITMEEEGVSKLVSVRLLSAAA